MYNYMLLIWQALKEEKVSSLLEDAQKYDFVKITEDVVAQIKETNNDESISALNKFQSEELEKVIVVFIF